MEYADGKPTAEVGWGHATPADIERLGGQIAYASREGGGSLFYFELPALAPAESAT